MNQREILLQKNILHPFDKVIVINNLKGCYGKIMTKFYKRILCEVKGRNVLDCGCGFGLLSSIAINNGFKVTSLDIDDESLQIAKTVYQIPLKNESIYKTSLPDKSQDVILFFDVIEHLDIAELFKELERLGAIQIIVYDSNLRNPFLRFYRHINKHKEYNEYIPADVIRKFSDGNYKLILEKYENFISLGISGGLQRRPVPFISNFPNIMYYIDSAISALLRAIKLDRYLCFRYLLVFTKDKEVE